MQQLDVTIEELFSTVPRCYKKERRSVDSSVRESVKRGLEPETEEQILLEPLTGNI
jgi:hypothetical protein